MRARQRCHNSKRDTTESRVTVVGDQTRTLPRDDPTVSVIGSAGLVGKDDLRLPAVIADLPCHTDALAAERSFGSAELRTDYLHM